MAIPPRGGLRITTAVRDHFVALAAAAYDIPPKDIMSLRRHRWTAQARQYAMWLLRNERQGDCEKYSLQEIGRVFGLDHSTVRHAVIRVEQRLAAQASEKGRAA